MAFAEDYREVPERIAEWYARHPQGRIVCEVLESPTEVRFRWTVKASVYRGIDPDEPPAGVGHSFLTVPGKTNYTRDSELENAETSAAGRALVMAGIPSKAVASTGEIESKKSEGTTDARGSTEPTPTWGAAQPAQDAGPSAGTGPSAPPQGTNPVPNLSEPEGSTTPTDSGEGSEGDGVPSGSDYLSGKERVALAKALGGNAKAREIAQARFGERIRSLSDLTRDMALDLVAERVG